MSQKEKLLKRLKARPKDFTYQELQKLMSEFGFEEKQRGKTSGSRVEFSNDMYKFILHKPHNGNTLKPYQIEKLLILLDNLEG